MSGGLSGFISRFPTMMFLIGVAAVFICTFGGFVMMGGDLHVITHAAPLELVVIGGTAMGATIIGNRTITLKRLGKACKKLVGKAKYTKASYIELLSMMYQTFKLAKTKGMLALEAHVEKPEESSLFGAFPGFQHDHHAVVFFCDYLRLVTLGSDKPYELEALMDEELDVHHAEDHEISHVMQSLADSLPAVGIVAAVLGVINTMGSISEPPEVLGRMIGHALVGTFLGVWMAYGFCAPMAGSLKGRMEEESKYMKCLKIGLLGHLQGYAPSISIEYARKAINSELRPSFAEVEEATAQLPAPT